MSEAQTEDERDAAGNAAEPGRPEPARLRRRPFGYRRADVDRALDTRDSDIAELRQDIAALWMAFAQHDRIIRAAPSAEPGAPGPPDPPDPAPDPAALQPPEPTHAAPAAAGVPESSPDASAVPEDVESIDRQLSDLDEVLAAIEKATQTLERTYADEVAAGPNGPSQVDRPGRTTAPDAEGRSASGVEDAGAGGPGAG